MYRSFVDCCNFTCKVNSHTSAVETHMGQKLRHFDHYVAKAKLFCQKCFIPVNRGGVFIWENLNPGYLDLGRKNRDLGN